MKRLTVVAVSVLMCILGGASAAWGQRSLSLPEAAAAGDVARIQQYVEQKADLNAPDRQGYSPLKLAVESYKVEAVKILLQGGANPNIKDPEGSTPIITAASTGQADVIEALLAAKADHTAKDSSGRTAIHCAVAAGQFPAIEALIAGGVDINAPDNRGHTPLGIAQQNNQQEIVDLLKQHGGTVPVVVDQYALYGDAAASSQSATAMQSQRPADFVIDANAIREQLRKLPAFEAPLKVIDANSESEQRAWIARRADNRTLMLRAVQKQFEDEMAFVKRSATEEKAAKTTKAVDDLVAARKKRYELVGQELRDQRRQTMQETRDSMATTRGRGTTARSGRGRSSTTGAGGYAGTAGAGPYGTAPMRPARGGAAAAEPNLPPIDPDSRALIDAWANAQPENKTDLLTKTHELDVVEYAVLHQSATEEQAAKTEVAIMALLMLREGRIAKIHQKWMEDDERTQRMQERMGTTGMPGTQPGMQPGTQQGMRRGRR